LTRDRIAFQSTIRHGPLSRAEGYPATFRVMMDLYTVVDRASITTNYTGKDGIK
jgi:hypothetical protein